MMVDEKALGASQSDASIRTAPSLLHSMMYTNPLARNWKSSSTIDPAILPFHQTLPNYGPTPLHPLPQIARELGVANVLVKDESHRFGLPAYKILGASWAVYRTVTQELGIPATASLADVRTAAQDKDYQYYTATDGNWGRAVARMASLLGAKAHVYVPKVMLESTKNKIAHEGAEVIVVDGDYDDAVMEAEKVSKEKPGFFITDMAWEWYTQIPQWVVDGYSTLMVEVDEQTRSIAGRGPNLIVCPVGCGSLAQAAIAHFKHASPSAAVLTVEPETAACVMASLENGCITPITTGDTAMCGLCCGTPAYIAWPYLKGGIDVHVTITEEEAKVAENTLREMGVHIGPCGAATLAGLRKACREGKEEIYLDHSSVVVLLGTEAPRGAALDMA